MATTSSDSPRFWTRDRFYTIDGRALPSVTTILDVIAKPGLGPWYAKQERQYFETAMLEVLSKPGARDPEYVLAAVVDAVSGVKAADRERQRASVIGTAVHAGIEWQLRTTLGEDAGPEPSLPEAAAWALESWKEWASSVGLEPLAIERTVYCDACSYAGTLDLYAPGQGRPDGTRLEERQGDLSRGVSPECGLPPRREAPRHAVGPRAHRPASEARDGSGLGGHAGTRHTLDRGLHGGHAALAMAATNGGQTYWGF